MQLLEIVDDAFDVIRRVGPDRVPGNLGDLPGRQFAEDTLRQRLALVLEARDLVADVDFRIITDKAELIDLRLELGNGFFEFEKLEIHGDSSRPLLAGVSARD